MILRFSECSEFSDHCFFHKKFDCLTTVDKFCNDGYYLNSWVLSSACHEPLVRLKGRGKIFRSLHFNLATNFTFNKHLKLNQKEEVYFAKRRTKNLGGNLRRY